MAGGFSRALFVVILLLQALFAAAWLVQSVVSEIHRFYWESSDLAEVPSGLSVRGERIFVVVVSGASILVSLVGAVASCLSLTPVLLAFCFADALTMLGSMAAGGVFVANVLRLDEQLSSVTLLLYLFPLACVIFLSLVSLGWGIFVWTLCRRAFDHRQKPSKEVPSSEKWSEFN